MDTDEATNAAEKAVTAALHERGWDVVASHRAAVELRLDVRFEGQDGTLRILYATETRSPEPAFVRVDLGARAGATITWEVTEFYVERLDAGGDREWVQREVYQSAIGATWSSVGLAVVPPAREEGWPGSIARLLTRAESLSPSRELEPRRAFLKASKEGGKRYIRRRRRHLRLFYGLSFGLAASALVVGLAGLLHDSVDLARAGLALAIVCAGAPTILLMVRRRRRPRPDLRWDAPVEALREAGVFDRVRRGPLERSVVIPVVCSNATGSASRPATMLCENAQAACSRHGLHARAEITRTRWPTGTLDACRVTPAAYFVLWLAGPTDQLDRLPEWSRGRRIADSVAWTFTEEELSDGSAKRALSSLAASLGLRDNPPYR